MAVAFVIYGVLALSLILTMVRVIKLSNRNSFLEFELEAADGVLKRRDEQIELLHKRCAETEAKASREAACSRVAAAQFDNALKMKDAAEGKLTQLRMDSTKALEHFQVVLQNIFGADTCKPLEQRDRKSVV